MTDSDLYKELALSDTYFFTRYFYNEVNRKKFVRNWHFEMMASKLDEVLRGDHPTNCIMFNLPPRHTKTLMAMIMFAAKGFAVNPQSEFIHLSASDNLVGRNVAQMREIMTCEAYTKIFPETIVSNNAKTGIQTTAGGVMYAAPFLGQVTGFGCGKLGADGFAGAMLIDDPMKTQDALSATIRGKVNFAWANTFSSRRNDPRTPVIVTAQRVHEEDFCGYLIKEEGTIEEGGQWDVIKLPAILDIGTEKERALWPERIPLTDLYRLRDEDKWVFDTQYMQNPKPIEGLMFPPNETRYYDQLPEEPDMIFNQCDPADTGNDMYCSKIYYIKDGDVFVADVIYTKENVDVTVPRHIEQIAKWHPSRANIESNSAWRMVARDIRNRCAEAGLETEIMRYNVHANKEVRIFNEAVTIRNRFYYLRPERQSKEYAQMMYDRHSYLKMVKDQRDDGVDCDAAASSFLKRIGIIPAV